jgi:hypothetical protein
VVLTMGAKKKRCPRTLNMKTVPVRAPGRAPSDGTRPLRKAWARDMRRMAYGDPG